MMSEFQVSRTPRVLFINDYSTEDYGVQYAYDGFCDLLGWENVIDWPPNPYHHTHFFLERTYDSQVGYPKHYLTEHDIVAALKSRWFDLVILTSSRDLALGTTRQLAPWIHSASSVVILDMEDSGELNISPFLGIDNFRHWQHRGIFKREYPAGTIMDAGGLDIHPFPFGYPRSRVVTAAHKDFTSLNLVFYRAHDWGWDQNSPRHRIVDAIQQEFQGIADVGLSLESTRDGVHISDKEDRLSLDEYHIRLGNACVGISLNEGGGSDCNRYWETVAKGCVLLSDYPRHPIPDNFIDGEEALFYSTPEECIEHLKSLNTDRARAKEIAVAGQLKMLEKHTTAARAKYVLEKVLDHCRSCGDLPSWVG